MSLFEKISVIAILLIGCLMSGCSSFGSFKGDTITTLSPEVDEIAIQKIAVLQFNEVVPEYGMHMAQVFSEELLNLRRYVVTERAQVDLQLKDLVPDGNIRGISKKVPLKEIGQTLGVEAVVLGEVEKVVTTVTSKTVQLTIAVRLIYTETGAVIWRSRWMGEPISLKTISPELWIQIATEMVSGLKKKLDALQRGH